MVKRASGCFAAVIGVGCILLAGCAGFSTNNVGDPTGRTRYEFERKLNALRVGMSADSLAVLFTAAEAPGEAGILYQAKVVTDELERVTYTLGWKSDPSHQIGVKDMAEIDVAKATVIAENARVISIQRHE